MTSDSPRGTLGPTVAGTWYPADPDELAARIADLIDRRQASGAGKESGRPRALIAPHAGYVYSGPVAAAGFGWLAGCSVDRVLVIGPSHYHGFQGAALPRAGGYITPLGEIPLDGDAIRELEGAPGVQLDDRPFDSEHSIEAELPFLQQLLNGPWRLVPVLIGGGSNAASLERTAAAMRRLVGPETLVVVSSDFVHYGARFGFVPFESEIPERIRQLDMGAIDPIVAGDRAGFVDYVQRTGATICGRDAIDVLLQLLPDTCVGRLIDYDTSGRLTNRWDVSVSYASLVFHDPEEHS